MEMPLYLIDIPQLEFIYYKQRAVLAWISAATGVVWVVVSLYRIPEDPDNPLSVHEVIPLRGTDLRCHDVSLGRSTRDRVNSHWVYDPSRPEKRVARFHGPEIDRPWHLHIQTHPRTIEV
jgi:hypothetical protein